MTQKKKVQPKEAKKDKVKELSLQEVNTFNFRRGLVQQKQEELNAVVEYANQYSLQLMEKYKMDPEKTVFSGTTLIERAE